MGKLQEFYDKRYKKGLCIYCGKNPYTEGKKTCKACRNKRKKPKDKTVTITIDGEIIDDKDLIYSSEFVKCGSEK